MARLPRGDAYGAGYPRGAGLRCVARLRHRDAPTAPGTPGARGCVVLRGSAARTRLRRRVPQGRGELREQPPTGRWSGDGSNSPFASVATRSVVVAERAVPRAPENAHRAAQRSRPRGGAAQQTRARRRRGGLLSPPGKGTAPTSVVGEGWALWCSACRTPLCGSAEAWGARPPPDGVRRSGPKQAKRPRGPRPEDPGPAQPAEASEAPARTAS
jgi:hypothetical protein